MKLSESTIIDILSNAMEGSRKQFAADLKARIEIVTKGRPYFRLYPKEVFSFIDETLNAEHPTPEQIREIEREELP